MADRLHFGYASAFEAEEVSCKGSAIPIYWRSRMANKNSNNASLMNGQCPGSWMPYSKMAFQFLLASLTKSLMNYFWRMFLQMFLLFRGKPQVNKTTAPTALQKPQVRLPFHCLRDCKPPAQLQQPAPQTWWLTPNLQRCLTSSC